ncbi:dynamin family protein [Anabaena sp. CCY 9910]|uniref:dynamin family protein n=1 Tax=Anabaena sp. CCY 9910 TaxID=3103870 RepID=UPI0039DF7E85
MINLGKISQEYPQLFDYLTCNHDELIRYRGQVKDFLKDCRQQLNSKLLNKTNISYFLSISKIEIDIGLNKIWQVTSLIAEMAEFGCITAKMAVFDLVVDTLILEIKKKKAFFINDLYLIINQNLYRENSETATLSNIRSYLELFEEETEARLLELAHQYPELRFVILSLLTNINLKPSSQYNDQDLEKYARIVKTERLAKKHIQSELDKLDKYLQYKKHLLKLTSKVLENHLDQQLNERNQEIITEIKNEEIMNNIQTWDDVRINLTTELKKTIIFLTEKGITDAANGLQRELSKIEENTYQIAFIATMKAGKSSLINAILGFELLPSLEKSCTGRLTFINHCDGETVAHISVKDKTLVISYRDVSSLKKYLNRYLESGLITNAEVYCSEVIEDIESITYISNPFEEIDENFDIHANQARLFLRESVISIKNIDAVELGSFINNKYVQELKIDTPIRYLKNHIKLDGIQLVDTPGPNSAAHTDHKRITYNFIDKANVVIYVIDFTKFDISGEDELLQEIKRQRERFNPEFYEKFFFVINKIDMHESYKGATLEDKLQDIRHRIQNGYGYKVPDKHIIGVAAKPALLYRIDEQGLSDKERKKEFQKFFAPFLDLDDVTPESVIQAKNQVILSSNIQALDNAIISYLQNSNQTKDLITDAINRANIYIQDYKRSLQESLGYSQKTLNELEEIVIRLKQWLKEAEADKNVLNQKIDLSKKKFRGSLIKKYNNFGEELSILIDKIFDIAKINNKFDGVWELITQSLGSVSSFIINFLKLDKSLQDRFQILVNIAGSIINLGDNKNENEINKVLKTYNDILTETTREMATKFEVELKLFASAERQKIFDEAYNDANKIITDLNRKIGDTLNIKLNTQNFVFPKIQLDSVIDKVESLYNSRKTGGGCCSSPKTVYSVRLDQLQKSSKENIKNAVKEAKKKILLLTEEGIEEIIRYLDDQINIQIKKLTQNLNEAINKQKTIGFNVQDEIVRLELEIEEVDEKLNTLDVLLQVTKNYYKELG